MPDIKNKTEKIKDRYFFLIPNLLKQAIFKKPPGIFLSLAAFNFTYYISAGYFGKVLFMLRFGGCKFVFTVFFMLFYIGIKITEISVC